MLVLSRRMNEKVIIGKNIVLQILDINRNHIKLGFEAPPDVEIHREEIFERIQQEALEKKGKLRVVNED